MIIYFFVNVFYFVPVCFSDRLDYRYVFVFRNAVDALEIHEKYPFAGLSSVHGSNVFTPETLLLRICSQV